MLRKFIFLLIAVIFTLNLVRQGKAINRITNERQQQEVKLEALQQDTLRLQEENYKVQTDEYLEKLAREKLGMIKEGEYSVAYKADEQN